MIWGNKRYNSLDWHYKEIFGKKVYKLSLDAGFTCPNRDGKVAYGGCIFCSENGSGDNAGDRRNSIKEQLQQQKEFLSGKFKSDSYIAYFQAYTNTYAPVEVLKKVYMSALEDEEIVGIAIATRPDCIDDRIIELLEYISKIKPVWIELGLQTIRDDVAEYINRGYRTQIFLDSVNKLAQIDVKIVVHLIIGLPNEDDNDVIEAVKYINNLPISGVKFHLLHILKNTRLNEIYQREKFYVYTFEKYCELLIKCIRILREDIVIHRLTGDAPKELLVEPMWSLKKIKVLNYINHRLKVDDIYQGIDYE